MFTKYLFVFHRNILNSFLTFSLRFSHFCTKFTTQILFNKYKVLSIASLFNQIFWLKWFILKSLGVVFAIKYINFDNLSKLSVS
ncbi:MAG: hypothetical protein LBC61_04005 [Candidatus Peribacteria bacterium]|nr:hypothetical protein [Candidatus Peribacteria bacterium]